MATQEDDKRPENAGSDQKCASIETLLDDVTSKLTEFEALKLPDLKKELEQVRDKKKAAVDEYTKEYKALRDKWCAQHQSIERLLGAVKCAFPDGKWKEILRACLCSGLAQEKALADKVRKRSNCCRGLKERAAEEKKALMEAAKGRLDALMALVAKIKALLADNDKLIEEVKQLLGGTTQADALYVFFVKLLKQHLALRPDDISDECKEFGDDVSVEKICEGVSCPPGKPDDSPCVEKPAPAQTPAQPTLPAPREVPWIVKPDDLDAAINCAAQAYRAAKDAAAAAEADYKKNPDDLESLKKELAKVRKELEETIRKCLKDTKVADKCCTKPTLPPRTDDGATAP